MSYLLLKLNNFNSINNFMRTKRMIYLLNSHFCLKCIRDFSVLLQVKPSTMNGELPQETHINYDYKGSDILTIKDIVTQESIPLQNLLSASNEHLHFQYGNSSLSDYKSNGFISLIGNATDDREPLSKLNPLFCQANSEVSYDTRNHSKQLEDLCKKTSSSNSPQNSPNEKNSGEENLNKIYLQLCTDLPLLFKKTLDFTIYHKDIVFENRIRGTMTKGLSSYVQQLAFMKLVGHIRFSFVQMKVLKITKHPEENTVKVRWKIIGVPFFRSLTLFFKSKRISGIKDRMLDDKWYEGFSTFYIGQDGLIHRHVADKMMPDEEREMMKDSITSRLASITGIAPKESVMSNSSSQSVRSEGAVRYRDNTFGKNDAILNC